MENKNILNELKNNNFVFKKQFGQNFITDKNLLSAIVDDANITQNYNVLEIGVGAGTLTQFLSEKAKKVIGIEIDKTLTEFLTNKFENTNVQIIFNDFMKMNAQQINDFFNNESFVVMANLPYYITTPIIFKLVEEKFNVKCITVMVQKEVAERFCAKENSKDYGIVTVILNAIAKVQIKRIVKREIFTPAPNVDSALVNFELNFNKYKINNFANFQKLVKLSFAMRRKTLINNLKSIYSNETIVNVFSKFNLNLNVRAENLSVEKFVELSNLLA